jgi:hypothetical protein
MTRTRTEERVDRKAEYLVGLASMPASSILSASFVLPTLLAHTYAIYLYLLSSQAPREPRLQNAPDLAIKAHPHHRLLVRVLHALE